MLYLIYQLAKLLMFVEEVRSIECIALCLVGSWFLRNSATLPANGLICPPIEARWDIIAMFHDALGHPGIAQTLRVLHMHYHWVGIKHDVALYVECCEPCQKVKIEIPMEPELQCPRVYGPLDHIHA